LLVARGGRIRSFHVETATKDTVREILVTNASCATKLHTDESNLYLYMAVGKEFAGHETVTHSDDEFVRGDVHHTNTIEGFFSIFKRGMRCVNQHCSEKHLHRYLVEFDHRYNHRVKLGERLSRLHASSCDGGNQEIRSNLMVTESPRAKYPMTSRGLPSKGTPSIAMRR
jgi:hypothetical protein